MMVNIFKLVLFHCWVWNFCVLNTVLKEYETQWQKLGF